MDRALLTMSAHAPGLEAAWGHYLGRLREENADAAVALPQEGLLIVSDGMGGVTGEMASRMIVEHLPQVIAYLLRTNDESADRLVEAVLHDALVEMNHMVREEASRVPGMSTDVGATVVVGYVRDDLLWVAHMGDSRAYLLRGAALRKLTHDHTAINQLVDKGVFDANDETNLFEWRGKLSKFIGVGGSATADVTSVPLSRGDRVLLCTDGLWETVPEDDMAQMLAHPGGPEQACRALLDAACSAGSRDNTTVLVAERTSMATRAS